MKFKKSLTLVLLALAVIGFGYGFYTSVFTTKANGKRQSATVTRGSLEETITLSGALAAEESVTLRFASTGKISWIGVKEGDWVKQYQRIASLDQESVRKQLEKALNAYMKYRWDLEQKREDYNWEDISGLTDTTRRIIEKSQFDVNSSILDVEIQNEAYKLKDIITPISGLVTRVDIPLSGVYISSPTQAEFDIVNPDTLYFSATVDQTEVVLLSQGMIGKVTLDAFPDKTFKCAVKKISFTPKDGETGTVYEIIAHFQDTADLTAFRLGMTGDITFSTRTVEDALYLPSNFVRYEGDQTFVTTKTNGLYKDTEVTIGLETGEYTQILSGLNEGDIVYD